MSWLDDLRKERVFHYEFEDGNVVSGTLPDLEEHYSVKLTGDPGETVELDGVKATRKGFDAVKVNQGGSVAFSHNGRTGRKFGNTVISDSKLHYLKTGETKNFYTKEYDQRLKKKVNDQLEGIGRAKISEAKERSNGKVSFARSKEFSKNKANKLT